MQHAGFRSLLRDFQCLGGNRGYAEQWVGSRTWRQIWSCLRSGMGRKEMGLENRRIRTAVEQGCGSCNACRIRSKPTER